MLPEPCRRGRIAIFLTDPCARIGEALDLAEVPDEQWAADSGECLDHADLERQLGAVDTATLEALVTAGIVERTDRPGVYLPTDDRIIGNRGRLVDRGDAAGPSRGGAIPRVDRSRRAPSTRVSGVPDDGGESRNRFTRAGV